MTIITPVFVQPDFNIAIVVSSFNQEITENLWKAAVATFKEKGFSDEQLLTVWVPGAVEIPLAAQTLAFNGECQAILALGAVIRGETNHYDYVCEQVSFGCQKVMLEQDIPVIFGVLTTENDAQALARSADNDENKGRQTALALLDMVSVLHQIS